MPSPSKKFQKDAMWTRVPQKTKEEKNRAFSRSSKTESTLSHISRGQSQWNWLTRMREEIIFFLIAGSTKENPSFALRYLITNISS